MYHWWCYWYYIIVYILLLDHSIGVLYPFSHYCGSLVCNIIIPSFSKHVLYSLYIYIGIVQWYNFMRTKIKHWNQTYILWNNFPMSVWDQCDWFLDKTNSHTIRQTWNHICHSPVQWLHIGDRKYDTTFFELD